MIRDSGILVQLIIIEPVPGFVSIITSTASDKFLQLLSKINYLRLVNCSNAAK